MTQPNIRPEFAAELRAFEGFLDANGDGIDDREQGPDDSAMSTRERLDLRRQQRGLPSLAETETGPVTAGSAGPSTRERFEMARSARGQQPGSADTFRMTQRPTATTFREMVETNPRGWGNAPPVERPYQGEMRSANTPMGDAAGEAFGPLAGHVVSSADNAFRLTRDAAGVVGAELTGVPAIMRGGERVKRGWDEGSPAHVAGGIAEAALGVVPGLSVTRAGAAAIRPAFSTMPRVAATTVAAAVPMSMAHGKDVRGDVGSRRTLHVMRDPVVTQLRAEISDAERALVASQDAIPGIKHKASADAARAAKKDAIEKILDGVGGSPGLRQKLLDAEAKATASFDDSLSFREVNPEISSALWSGGLAVAGGLGAVNSIKNRLANTFIHQPSIRKTTEAADNAFLGVDAVGGRPAIKADPVEFEKQANILRGKLDRYDDSGGGVGQYALPAFAGAEFSALPEQIDFGTRAPGHPARDAAADEFSRPGYWMERAAPALLGTAAYKGGKWAGEVVTPGTNPETMASANEVLRRMKPEGYAGDLTNALGAQQLALDARKIGRTNAINDARDASDARLLHQDVTASGLVADRVRQAELDALDGISVSPDRAQALAGDALGSYGLRFPAPQRQLPSPAGGPNQPTPDNSFDWPPLPVPARSDVIPTPVNGQPTPQNSFDLSPIMQRFDELAARQPSPFDPAPILSRLDEMQSGTRSALGGIDNALAQMPDQITGELGRQIGNLRQLVATGDAATAQRAGQQLDEIKQGLLLMAQGQRQTGDTILSRLPSGQPHQPAAAPPAAAPPAAQRAAPEFSLTPPPGGGPLPERPTAAASPPPSLPDPRQGALDFTDSYDPAVHGPLAREYLDKLLTHRNPVRDAARGSVSGKLDPVGHVTDDLTRIFANAGAPAVRPYDLRQRVQGTNTAYGDHNDVLGYTNSQITNPRMRDKVLGAISGRHGTLAVPLIAAGATAKEMSDTGGRPSTRERYETIKAERRSTVARREMMSGAPTGAADFDPKAGRFRRENGTFMGFE